MVTELTFKIDTLPRGLLSSRKNGIFKPTFHSTFIKSFEMAFFFKANAPYQPMNKMNLFTNFKEMLKLNI